MKAESLVLDSVNKAQHGRLGTQPVQRQLQNQQQNTRGGRRHLQQQRHNEQRQLEELPPPLPKNQSLKT